MLKQKIILFLTDKGVELWRDISDWEGYYQISSFGRIKTNNGTIRKTNTFNNSGYLMITLKSKKSGNKPQTKTVHRLVAKAFLLDFVDELDVCHIDDDKKNNILSNLKMDTHINNCNEGSRNEKLSKINLGRKGELNAKSKKCYCYELDMTFVNTRVAKEYLDTINRKGNVCKCCRGDSKTAGGYHWKYV